MWRVFPLGGLMAACLAFSVPAGAQTLTVGAPDLLGVPIGTEAETAIAGLVTVLGQPGHDSGWISGCEFNGIDERYLDWGGLTAAFEEGEAGSRTFAYWTYRIDAETGAAIPGGPAPDQVALPGGVRLGEKFSDAAKAYGFSPVVDDVFGIGMHSTETFTIMTALDSIDAPITEVGTPYIALCD